jgi:hypothetical protein
MSPGKVEWSDRDLPGGLRWESREEPQEGAKEVERATDPRQREELPERRVIDPTPPPPVQVLRDTMARQMRKLNQAVEQSEETLAQVYSGRFVGGEY